MATEYDQWLIEQIMGATSLSELEPFESQGAVGFGSRALYETKKLLEADARAALAEAQRDGTYYASADDLWNFSQEHLVPRGQQKSVICNNLFSDIARATRPPCYKKHRAIYQPPGGNIQTPLPDFQDASVGTNSTIDLQETDILGNRFKRKEPTTHLIHPRAYPAGDMQQKAHWERSREITRIKSAFYLSWEPRRRRGKTVFGTLRSISFDFPHTTSTTTRRRMSYFSRS